MTAGGQVPAVAATVGAHLYVSTERRSWAQQGLSETHTGTDTQAEWQVRLTGAPLPTPQARAGPEIHFLGLGKPLLYFFLLVPTKPN